MSTANSVGNAISGLGIPGFANGVENFSGGLAMVGEAGPELVRLPRNSSVIPSAKTSAMLSSSGGGGSSGPTVIKVYIDGQQVHSAVQAQQSRYVARNGRSAF